MKTKKTNSELIIDTLRSGDSLRSPDITARVSELGGKEVKIQDVASILAKLSNSAKCDLGYIISKKKTERGYVYDLVKEAAGLEAEQIYDLTRKTGKDRFTINDAVKKVPGLKKYLKSAKTEPTLKAVGRPAAKAQPLASKGVEVSDSAMREILAGFLKEVIFQGGLNVNVNVTVQFKGLN
ncbi:MAG: hypothetical protein C4518_16690 [Desulfobacteraceae bacterium]|nr:MAG: hypothetical protein C4518_16690 [Desulfobacteraceae bacterium]